MNEKKVPRSWAITRWALLENGASATIVSNGVMHAATGHSTHAEQVTSDD